MTKTHEVVEGVEKFARDYCSEEEALHGPEYFHAIKFAVNFGIRLALESESVRELMEAATLALEFNSFSIKTRDRLESAIAKCKLLHVPSGEG